MSKRKNSKPKSKKRILTVAIDGKRPNLALAKVKSYYEKKGYLVVEDYKKLTQKVEKIYISCLFDWNREKVLPWLKSDCPVVVGGSGWKESRNLPGEIEKECPRINYGYTSRGCPRRCPWCSVWKREGKFRPVHKLLDLWDGSSKDITLLDNNILADDYHFHQVCWDAYRHGIRLHFYQGLDYRFINLSVANSLAMIRHRRYRFSFDEPKNFEKVDEAITWLSRAGISLSQWFVLVGYNTTLKEDLARINFLRRRGQLVYLARYDYTRAPEYIPLARWTQNPKFFAKMTFFDFLKRPENFRYRTYWEGLNPNR